MPAPDPDDRCAVCSWLRAKLIALLGGETIAEIEFIVGSGSGRRVKKVPPNVAALREQIAIEEAACAAQQGGPPKRHAIIGGWRR